MSYQPEQLAERIVRPEIRSPFRIGELVVDNMNFDAEGNRRLVRGGGSAVPEIVVTHLYNGVGGGWSPDSFIGAEIESIDGGIITFSEYGSTRRVHEVTSTGTEIEPAVLRSSLLRMIFPNIVDLENPDLENPRFAGYWHMQITLIDEQFAADKLMYDENLTAEEVALNTRRNERKQQIAQSILLGENGQDNFMRNPSLY